MDRIEIINGKEMRVHYDRKCPKCGGGNYILTSWAANSGEKGYCMECGYHYDDDEAWEYLDYLKEWVGKEAPDDA